MRILVLSHTSDLIGGAERSMLDVFDNWTTKHNVEPEFIVREPLGSLAGELKRRGWKYYPVRFTFWSWPNPPTKPEDIFRESVINSQAVQEIEKIIQSSKPDVVMTNTVICPWAALAAHFQQVPHVWFVREYGDLDHGRKFDIDHRQIFEDMGNLSNLVVANSKTMAAHIEDYVDKAKVATLYNPFDIEKLNKKASAKITRPYKHAGSLKLVMTSNISRTKGQLEAVEATGLLNKSGHDTELCLVGKNVDKTYSNEINDVIKKYGIADKVHLVGLQANALAYVAAADVGIIASYKEAFGRTTFEYLAIGKPVAGADSGATPEMVENGVNGFLFKPGDAKDLSGVLKKYIDNPSLLKEHGESSAKKAADMMDSRDNIDALFKKVEAVVSGKGKDKLKPIHYLHQWFYYQDNASQFINSSGETSIRKTLRLRLRQKAKTNYYRAKKVKARLIGK